MDSAGLEKEINRGKGIFTEIVRVTSDFFESFEALGPDDIRSFEVRRQRLLEDLLAFQSAFRQKLAGREKDLPLAMAGQLEEFRIFQEVFVQIIMEKNGAILSKANQSLERVRAGLDAVGRGKQAMRGYNRKRSRTRNRLDKTA